MSKMHTVLTKRKKSTGGAHQPNTIYEVPLVFKFTVSLMTVNFKIGQNVYTTETNKILFPAIVWLFPEFKNLIIDKESSSAKQVLFYFDF